MHKNDTDVNREKLKEEFRKKNAEKEEEQRQQFEPDPDEDEEDIFRLEPYPVLSDKVFHGLAGRFVKLASRESEADPAAILFTFLTRAGIELGLKPLSVGEAKHYPRLFTAVVGHSSKSRKGTSAKPVTVLFKSLAEMDMFTAQTSYGPLSSGEGLIYAVRDETVKWEVDKKTKTGDWVVTDPGVDDKRLFILDEELAGCLAVMAREGNTLSAILRMSWDNGDIAPLTKNNRIRATGAHIGVVTHITYRELKSKLQDDEMFNGFANRFLWVCAKRLGLIPFPEPMPEDELFLIRSELREVLEHAKTVDRMYFTPETKETWKQVYPELSKDVPGLLGGVSNRAEAQAIRLSMIYALLDRKKSIEPEHLEAALAAWQYAFDSCKYIFGNEMNPTAKKILTALRKKPLSAAEITRELFQRNIKAAEIKEALKELIALGRIREEMQTTKGRPKTVYYFND